MPKKSEFLPPPKPDSHPEEAAILTRIFKKEPLITYRELLDKYKSEVSKQQGLLGLLGLFTTYLDRPNDDPLIPQLIQAKQAALQMEILSRPIDGNLSMPETEIQILAKAALKSALFGLPDGLACYFTCYGAFCLRQYVKRTYGRAFLAFLSEPKRPDPVQYADGFHLPQSAQAAAGGGKRGIRWQERRKKRVHHRDDGFSENHRVGRRRQPDEL